MPKISVIMPVYNGENFLQQSVSSVLNQTFKDFELICIDDSSCDNSYNFLQEIAKSDSRLKVYKKENSGPGESLNWGISFAKGDYLCFIDQDDFYSANYLEKMYNSINNTDFNMCFCYGYEFYDDGLEIKIPYPNFKTNYIDTSSIKKKSKISNTFYPQWNKIIRKSFYIKNKISFPSIQNKAHDVPVHYQLLYLCNKIGLVKDCIYYHRLHSGQITNNLDLEKYALVSFYNLIEWMNKSEIIKNKYKFKNLIKHLLISAYSNTQNVNLRLEITDAIKNNYPKISAFLLLNRLKKKHPILKLEKIKGADIYTYCAGTPTIVSPLTTIGKFCSFGINVQLGQGKHPLNFLSTSPYLYFDNLGFKTNDMVSYNEFWNYEPIKIGNDVWIGNNVTVKNGVKIGDGAVIGMNSVVLKDIPPYAIAVGVPAKVIKYRFNENTIQELLKLKWWDLDENIIKKIPYDNIESAIDFIKQYRK